MVLLLGCGDRSPVVMASRDGTLLFRIDRLRNHCHRTDTALSRQRALYVEARNKRRRARTIARVRLAELALDLLLLASGETHVHVNQHREHGQRQQRRPLYQEAQHDEHEADVLWMADG